MEDLSDHIVEIDNDDLDDIEPVGDEAQLYEHFRVVVDKGQEMVRVDKYLFDRITNASRNRIQKAADAGFVMANGKPVKCSYRVKPMDVITVMMDRPRYDNEVVPEDIDMQSELSKENQLRELLIAKKKLTVGTSEWLKIVQTIADITQAKKDEIQTEDNTIHYYLPLTCSMCELYQKAKKK